MILNKKNSIGSCPHPYKQTFIWPLGRSPPEPYPPHEEEIFSITKDMVDYSIYTKVSTLPTKSMVLGMTIYYNCPILLLFPRIKDRILKIQPYPILLQPLPPVFVVRQYRSKQVPELPGMGMVFKVT